MMNVQPIIAAGSSSAKMDRVIASPRLPWWRRRLTIVALMLGMIGLLGWRLMPAGNSSDIASSDLETGLVTRSAFKDYVPIRATVTPRQSTFVGAPSGGQVEKLLVQDGTTVVVGQPLAMLSNPELKLEVLTREAEIAGRLGDVSGQDLALERNRLDRASQIDQARYDLIKARRDLSTRQRLREQGFVSEAGVRSFAEEEAYQQKRLAQLQAGGEAETRISKAQENRLVDTRNRLAGNLAAVRAGLDALVIRAPSSGRLTNFTLQPGQTLKVGDATGQVDSEGSWKLVADVDEYYLGRVLVGQKASTADGALLTVSKVLPAVNNGRFKIDLAFARAPTGLNRGQTLDTRVVLGATSSAIVVPPGGWLDSGAGSSIFVVDGDGRHARRRTISIGRRNPEQVEVLSGLNAGERIITSNTSSLKGDLLNLR